MILSVLSASVPFLSECQYCSWTNQKPVSAGEFSGPPAIPLPLGISITFRRLEEAKRPGKYTPNPDLQGLLPLAYDRDKSKKLSSPKNQQLANKQAVRPLRDEFNSFHIFVVGIPEAWQHHLMWFILLFCI
ncbi:hypothetical protein RJ641_010666 [Dillenia turbinata]|uniref:Uncharacterized protein n=1 Tax=Dillenia turbinata TaxID=194707 RepID=A0AAN8Z4I0_9MAGN